MKTASEMTYTVSGGALNSTQAKLNRVPASPGGKGGKVTSAGWQVTLCDPMWHVSSRIAVWQPCELLYTCYLLTACHHITHYYHHHLPPHNDITSDTVRTPYQWRRQGEGRG